MRTLLLAGVLNTSPVTQVQVPDELMIIGEINRYQQLCLAFDSKNDDIYLFWRRMVGQLPVLFSLARVLLAIPISSADAERSFSVAGALLRAKRASMNPLRAHKVLFVHDNVRILEENHLKKLFGEDDDVNES